MDRDEFAERVRAGERMLYCIARTMLSPSECEDAIQAAVLKAWENLPQLRDEAAFDAWLKRILCNECYKILRRLKREAPTDPGTLAAAGEDSPPPEESALTEALAALRPEDRLLLLLHHDEGYSLQEIAAIVHVPQPVLKMRLHRARNRLRTELERRGEIWT